MTIQLNGTRQRSDGTGILFTLMPVEETQEDTVWWVEERGFVSIIPLRPDLTNEQELAKTRERISLEKGG